MKILKIVIICIALLLSAGCAQGLTELPLQTALVMTGLGSSAEQVIRPTATPESEPTARPQETPTEKDRFSVDADVMAQIRQRTTNATQQQTVSSECVYVSYDEAIEIAFWDLDERTDGNETLCGYGGLAQKIQDNRDILNLDNTFGIAAGTLGNDEAVAFYRNFATLLHRDAERTNGEAYRKLMRSLSEGDTTQAIVGLNNILLGVDWWATLEYGVSADQPAMLFISEKANGGPFILFLGEDAVGDAQIVLAHVYIEADLDLAFEAFMRIIERVTDSEAPQMDLNLPKHACDYLDKQQAAVILGEDVEIVDELVDNCGYIPAGSLYRNEEGSFVGLSFYSGNDAADFIDSIIEDLIDQSRHLDRDVETAVEAALMADDFGAALRLLPNLAVDPEALFFSARPDLSVGTIGVEWEMDDQSLRGLMTEGANGEIVFLLVTYVEIADEDILLTAMDAFFADIIVKTGNVETDSVETDSVETDSVETDSVETGRVHGGVGGDQPTLTAEERLADCYALTSDQVETILGEAVTPETTIDEDYGYCVFKGAVPSAIEADTDIMPTYGPVWETPYLAVTVSPVGDATDPIMYLSFAILDRNHSRLGEFLPKLGSTAALEELARAESAMPGLSRQFLADVGDGALWYWQELSSGYQLGGLYVMNGAERVVLQVVVNPERTEEDAQSTLIEMANWLINGQ